MTGLRQLTEHISKTFDANQTGYGQRQSLGRRVNGRRNARAPGESGARRRQGMDSETRW